jgi:signal transduction histidine kinase
LMLQALLIAWLLYERRARHRAELDSRKNLALAADVSRREMMSVLGTAFAHDLAQPVSSIMYNAEVLEVAAITSRMPPDTMQEILADIRVDAVRAGGIIDRYRKMLRSQDVSKKPMDIRVVLRESLALVSHEIRTRDIALAIELPAHACVVNGDHILLQQVLVNLLMNAIDAMAQTPPGQRQLSLRCNITRRGIEVSVRDAGRGLPPDIVDNVFTPFFTTKSHGLGIGLAIVRTIVRAHGGTIDAHNNLDQGATFAFVLPSIDVPPMRQDETGRTSTTENSSTQVPAASPNNESLLGDPERAG